MKIKVYLSLSPAMIKVYCVKCTRLALLSTLVMVADDTENKPCLAETPNIKTTNPRKQGFMAEVKSWCISKNSATKIQ